MKLILMLIAATVVICIQALVLMTKHGAHSAIEEYQKEIIKIYGEDCEK